MKREIQIHWALRFCTVDCSAMFRLDLASFVDRSRIRDSILIPHDLTRKTVLLTLFEINSGDSIDGASVEHVRVVDTHLGKATYSVRPYPAGSVISEITGRVFDDDSGADDYTFEYDDQLLEPVAPFRFLNHSCAANCDFQMLDIPATEDQPASRGLYLIAIDDIQPEQELTIDYNWPASHAIECDCQQPECRGWVVAEEELSLLM